jgi:hypothetical protein
VSRLAAIIVAVVVFVVIAALLARWLTVENGERDDVAQLLQAQARGDAAQMLDRLDGCAQDPRCAAAVRANAQALRSDGKLDIVAYDSSTAYSLGGASGPTRVVWTTPGRLPTVQCVAVRRTGNVLSGVSVSLTALSRPIGRTSAC